MAVPLVQLTTSFLPNTQVHSVFCPGLSRLHLLCSLSGNQALFQSFARQQQPCRYLNVHACMDGQ
jgi:hypothetical protein